MVGKSGAHPGKPDRARDLGRFLRVIHELLRYLVRRATVSARTPVSSFHILRNRRLGRHSGRIRSGRGRRSGRVGVRHTGDCRRRNRRRRAYRLCCSDTGT